VVLSRYARRHLSPFLPPLERYSRLSRNLLHHKMFGGYRAAWAEPDEHGKGVWTAAS